MLSVIDGYKTYLAALLLLGIGIYQLSQGQTEAGLQTIGQGLGLVGLRSALSNASTIPPPGAPR